MDPATVLAAAQAIGLIVKTLQQYSNGEITLEQANAVFEGSKAGHAAAWDRFVNARGPNEQPAGT